MLLELPKIFANEYLWMFSKNYVLKKGKILTFFGKEIKWKVAIRMHYSQAEIDRPPKIALQPTFFLLYPFSLMLLMDFFKKYV